MGYVAYYRVSTKAQGDSGLGLESQRAILCNYLDCDSLIAEFTEVASAKDIAGRPLLQQAVALCLSGGHTLAVAKIDRLSRRTQDALAIHEKLGGRLYSCDIHQEGGKMDKFSLTIFMAIADRERELIGIRTKSALEAARARGTKLGNDGEYLSEEARQRGAETNHSKAVDYYDNNLVTDKVLSMRQEGYSMRAIAEHLNSKESISTQRGGKFYAATVKRILDRAAA